MKKILLYLIPLLICSCTDSGDHDDRPDAGDEVAVTINIETDAPQIISRGLDGESISDVQIYISNNSANETHLLAAGQSRIEYRLKPGTYTVIALANSWKTISGMGEPQVRNVQFSLSELAGRTKTLMSCEGRITVSATENNFTLDLKRAYAKLTCEVQSDNPGITIEGVELRNVALTSKVVDPNTPTDAATMTYGTVTPECTATPAGGLLFETVLLENKCGAVPGITNQKERTPAIAPPGATHILIMATNGTEKLHYNVFLGNNDTDDFNVVRNTHYQYRISIRGADPADLRIERFEINGDNT